MNKQGMIRIFLVGYMGAGKTTLGKVLAKRMNLSYIDTDHFIENRYHKKVGDIFAAEGEDRFRDMEHRILCEVSEIENVVISTGGGLPCFNDNMLIMKKTGTTVYLDVSVEELAARLQTSRAIRPILQNRSGMELTDFIKKNLNKRRPFYEQAKICFNADLMYTDCDVEALAEKLELFIYNQ
ncbi:MAG: shikimate kinase [Tannerella sp.]|jgi:shikimate kinase|nr:shikimate kinase [Tannerella sp.]